MNIAADMLGAMQNLLGKAQPPEWLVREIQNRIVLTLNHVLQQEAQAMDRLKRQSGKTVLAQLQPWSMRVRATPAGLLELAEPEAAADLTLTVTDGLPALLGKTVQGEKPATHIEGDVQLAAEINWLIDHVRWDFEEDLSKLVGDATAHNIGKGLRTVAGALRQFVASFQNKSSS